MKILILGGTEEARTLADALVDRGHGVITSLAGRTSDPLLPKGDLRSGGFGGPENLAAFLREEGFDRLVDATHPYAQRIAHCAVEAANLSGVPMIRLTRPPWTEPQYAFWRHVRSAEEAAQGLPTGARVLLTVGHRGIDLFLARSDCSFLVRSIEPPDFELPPHARSLISRPPFYVGAETELMRSHGITCLVTKNSGGVQTEAKLEAARQLRVPVVMIARPQLPPAKEVVTVGRAIAALQLER
jgi:precorrin-6A/cobalt-precorrin-6A reductase